MDFKAFKEQIAAARKVEIKINGATFRAELPTEYAYRLAVEANADAQGRVQRALMFRDILKSAVTGWDGVKTTDILPGSPEELIPFSAEALDALLDSNQSLSDELVLEISERAGERREQREAARKN